ncbi:MAG TPA: LLM class flavin-dependent oxidoreductase, partial [Agromyces sp.]
MRAAVSLGLPGTTDRETLRALAPRLERLGFHALWLNDVPGGDSLAGLRAAGEVTDRLRLATGVIPLDRRP